jgi:hypothetical protein
MPERKISKNEFTMQIDPKYIRFEHSKIRPKFSDQKSVQQTLQDIIDKKVQLKDIPHISVVPIDDKHFCSLNNRRLWVFKQLRDKGLLPGNQIEVRVKPVQNSRRLKDKYTLEKCSDTATFMKEGEKLKKKDDEQIDQEIEI